jgi:hypothetical protein
MLLRFQKLAWALSKQDFTRFPTAPSIICGCIIVAYAYNGIALRRHGGRRVPNMTVRGFTPRMQGDGDAPETFLFRGLMVAEDTLGLDDSADSADN